MLEVRNLSVQYGAIRAVRDVSLSIRKGEVVSLLGANGAGKTSLVSACVGTIPKSGGAVTFDGSDITRLPAEAIVRRRMTLSPEGRRVFADLSVRENLLLGAATRRDRVEVAKDIETYFSMFPILGERSAQAAKTLSGGEQQMLAIGRALMTNPRLLVLDEATEGLAPVVRQEIWAGVRELKAQGLSILLVDKSLKEIASVADRAVVLERGETAWSGAIDALTPDLADRYLGV